MNFRTRLYKVLVWAATGVLLHGTASALPINEVDYFSLTPAATIDFEGLAGGNAPGTNYDGLLTFSGATIGERFNGQTLSFSGNSDVLGGSPVGTLSVIAGAANQNLNIFNSSGSQVLTGLGPLGFPAFDAIGEGAIAILFDSDQSEFGFQSVGGNLGGATFDFFRRDGSLIASLNPTGLGVDFFGFMREGGLQDIAGISIWNTDPAGIGFDNIIFDVPGDPDPVPEPGILTLLGIGLFGLGLARRRKV